MDRFADAHGTQPSQQLTNEELAQLVRLDLARALKTINHYGAHQKAAQDPAAAKVLEHLRDDEKAHVGELLALLQYLDPEEGQHYTEGAAEATKLLMQLGIDVTTTGSETSGAMVVVQPAPLVPLRDVPARPTKRPDGKGKKGDAKKAKGKGKKGSKKER